MADEPSSVHPRPRGKDRRVPQVRRAVAAALAQATAAGMPPRLDGVVAACSGGPDSTVLADALAWWQARRGTPARLVLAHYRHGLHERDAEMAAHVQQLAVRLGAPCVIGQWVADAGGDPAARVQAGEGLEDAARRARYAFLARVAQQHGCPAVATGHTLDDQAETVLMRLLAGTGLPGLAAMRVSRPFCVHVYDAEHEPSASAGGATAGRPLWVLRPLLAVRRAAVLAYLAAEGLTAVDDPTNADPARLRNRVRHDVLPLLTAINPAAAEHLAAVAGDAAALAPLVAAARTQRAGWAFALDAPPRFVVDRQALPVSEGQALALDVLRGLLTQRLGIPPRRVTRHVLHEVWALAAAQPGRTASLPDGWTARVRRPTPDERREYATAAPPVVVEFIRTAEGPPAGHAGGREPPAREPAPAVRLNGPGVYEFPALGRRWRLQIETVRVDARTLAAHRQAAPAHEALLADSAVQWPLTLRAKRPGERMQPLGAPGRRPIKEVLRERGVPVVRRATWPLLLGADGQPLWLCGLVTAEAARLPDEPGTGTGDGTAAWRCTLYDAQTGRPFPG